MRTRFFATIGIGFVFVLLSPAAGAYTYDTDNLPYSDTAPDQSTAVSVSLLTELGIVEGNPDGTFRFNSLLNRAEYMQIVMRLEPTGGEGYTTPCFPDVPVNAWYTDAVCRAKALGIVRGNADPNRDSSQWRFEPSRPVLYAEAVKVLAELYNYDVPTVAAGEWYEPYLIAARRLDTALPESPEPGMQLTRGDMARLTARFIAEDEGELSQLMIAQSLPTSSSSSSESSQSSEAESSVDSSSVSSGTGSSLSSSSSVSSPSSSSVTYDAQALPAVVTSAFLPMGEVSPVVGAATIFSEQQPLDVDRLVVRLLSGVSSVDGLLLYDDTGRYLGRATRDSDYPGDRQYALRFIDGTLTIPKEEEWSFYARADVKAFDEGGVSGQVFQISRMGVEGTGVWNTKSQSEFSSGDYPIHQIAASLITTFKNAGPDEDILISGNNIRIGVFDVAGVTKEPSSDLEITRIIFQINRSGGVTLTNAELATDGFNERHACTVASTTITCDNIPAYYTSLEDEQRRLSLYADVGVGSGNQTLQISVNEPGSYGNPGVVQWTDGTTSFHWVQFEQPVARSSVLRQ